jgi:hypothetical protein
MQGQVPMRLRRRHAQPHQGVAVSYVSVNLLHKFDADLAHKPGSFKSSTDSYNYAWKYLFPPLPGPRRKLDRRILQSAWFIYRARVTKCLTEEQRALLLARLHRRRSRVPSTTNVRGRRARARHARNGALVAAGRSSPPTRPDHC